MAFWASSSQVMPSASLMICCTAVRFSTGGFSGFWVSSLQAIDSSYTLEYEWQQPKNNKIFDQLTAPRG